MTTNTIVYAVQAETSPGYWEECPDTRSTNSKSTVARLDYLRTVNASQKLRLVAFTQTVIEKGLRVVTDEQYHRD